MIAQYTQAAIVSEMKRLAVPACVDSIPSRAMQEDHVSMGWYAARKLRRSVDGLSRVVAIELLTAARALDLRTTTGEPPDRARAGDRAPSYDLLRAHGVGAPGPDRYLSPEIEATVWLVHVRCGARRRRRSDRRARMSENPRLPIHAAPRHRADRRSAGRPRRRCGC